MGIYEHCGFDGSLILLKELMTEKEIQTICPAGYQGRRGEIWYVRILPNPVDPDDGYSVILTTPYRLLMQDKTDWEDFFERNAISKGKPDFNKKFHGKTLVLPDTAEQILGNLGSFFQSLNVGRGELVKMEDPEFEKYFVVYGDDQIEARYILSTSLMQRVLEFRKKTGRRICMSFVSSHVYVAIPYSRRLFEPRVFGSILGFKGIEQYLEDFQVFTGIVEDLNVNTRIWTKRAEEPLSPAAQFFLNFPAGEPY